MRVGPGTRIGPYEVAALIGDTNLKRTVALKVLPDSGSRDGPRQERAWTEELKPLVPTKWTSRTLAARADPASQL